MKLTFEPNCVTARLTGRMNPDFLDDLDTVLAPHEPGYFFNPAYKAHRWDGKYHFLHRESMTFPAGLTPHVLDLCEKSGYAVTVEDLRPVPVFTVNDRSLRGITLAPDQLEALDVAFANPRGTLCLPTGAGKTEIACVLARSVTPKRVLVLVDKKGLLTQTAERLELRLGEKVGRLGGGFRDTKHRITVATVQTTWARRKSLAKFFQEIYMVIFDECHRIAKTALRVLAGIHAPIRYGLSATIKEAPRKLFVEAFLGPILIEQSFEELVASGRAAVPHITMFRIGGIIRGDTFRDVYRYGVAENDMRNRVILDLVIRHAQAILGEQVMVMVFAIEHGKMLAALLTERLGQPVPFLHGETPLPVIDATKKQFQAREIPVMVVSTIFDFGQDVPAVDVMVMAAAGKAPLRTIQRMGRATRRKTGANVVVIYDFYDQNHPWLKDHADQRRRTYIKKGFPPVLRDMPRARVPA